ncbi:GMC oxidoreductase-domain-containing protein [Tribonema minus]|uniref:GMC oxidoreductase-domain-containing protein n=1 Tax=Tribonema minus TaxID=303371 RepID=A0A835Z8N3_9STRA|nr:GMC oxidoreductase-domain-containing protein [Tribonema minus]
MAAAAVSGEAYKYVVVGGGTCGCVLADRLTEDKANSVLVLEAGTGKHRDKNIKVPVGILRLFRSAFDWQYETEREEHAGDRGIYLARGKVLGGSSCLNAMLYTRGASADYNSWGVKGWSAEEVLPYFRRSEGNRNLPAGDYHGKDGAYSVEFVRYKNPLHKLFHEACLQAGLPTNDDFNNWSRSQEGLGAFQCAQKFGRRVTAASSYLKRAMKRKNLAIETQAHATRVLFDGDKAIGVEYVKDGEKQVAKIQQGGEVLMCGGAINSPQLLLLSGVGPADHLQAKGVPVVKDLQGVGANLQDQPAVTVMSDVGKPISITDDIFKKGSTKVRPSAALKWLLFGRGPLTSPGCDHGGFLKTKADLPEADLQIRFVPGRAETPDGVQAYRNIGDSGQFNSGVTVQVIGCRPKSRGHLKLKSSDPFEKPEIVVNYLDEQEDVRTLVRGVEIARTILAQDSFKGTVTKEVFPGPSTSGEQSVQQYISSSVHSANAIAGTCKMGEGDDAVVDNNLRVKGLKSLRVVDTSVMPSVPGGQLASVAVMIAEKAADMILQKA